MLPITVSVSNSDLKMFRKQSVHGMAECTNSSPPWNNYSAGAGGPPGNGGGGTNSVTPSLLQQIGNNVVSAANAFTPYRKAFINTSPNNICTNSFPFN